MKISTNSRIKANRNCAAKVTKSSTNSKSIMFNFMKKDTRSDLASISADQQNIYNNAAALRQLIAELESPLVTMARGAGPNGPHGWNPGCYSINIMPHLDHRLPAAKAALDAIERSPEYTAAEKLITPILKALAELEAAEAEAAQKLQEKKNALAESLAKANAVALEKAKLDPAVVAARRELESLGA